MKRYILASLSIGLPVAAVVSAATYAGVLSSADPAIATLLRLPQSVQFQVPAWQYVLIAVLALGVVWCTVDIPLFRGKTAVALTVSAQAAISSYLASLFGYYFNPVPALAATGLGFVLGLLYARTEAGRRKRWLQTVFGSRISPKHFDILLNDSTPLDLTGVPIEATILSARIGNAEELDQSLAAPQQSARVNTVMDAATRFLVERGAFLERCDGGGLRAVFGAPVPDPRHATHAVIAALDLLATIEQEPAGTEPQTGTKPKLHIGLNSGRVIAGAFGCDRLASYSVSGETADLAEKIAAANSAYGTQILTGPDTFVLSGDAIVLRAIDLFSSPDHSRRMEIYEPMATAPAENPQIAALRDTFWEALILFRAGHAKQAADAFHRVLELEKKDGPTHFYLGRLHMSRTGSPPTAAHPLTPLGLL